MVKIRTKIYSTDKYSANEVHVIFEVSNVGSGSMYVLKRNTPLEGLKTDCLIVKRGGRRIPYDGLHVKRLPPGPEELVLLKPGETITSKIEVSDAYDLSKKGSVTIEFNRKKLQAYPAPVSGTMSFTLDAAAEPRNRAVTVISDAASLKLAAKKRLTVGQRFRSVQKKSNGLKVFVAASGPKIPTIKVAANSAENQVVVDAHNAGYDLTAKALKDVKKDPHYVKWFGKYSKARLKKVKADYQKVRDRMQENRFTYVCHDGPSCSDSTFAYTTHGGSTIWLCGAFWAAAMIGTDSKAGTILHEHTHASAMTDDITYGQQGCLQLAKTTPDKAVRNADTHEYYAGG